MRTRRMCVGAAVVLLLVVLSMGVEDAVLVMLVRLSSRWIVIVDKVEDEMTRDDDQAVPE